MPTTRTYQVGVDGKSFRLDNLSGPWVDVSVYISSIRLDSNYLDVETDPTDGDKVIVVGTPRVANGWFGIYVSTDAGVTWTQPGGNYSIATSVVVPGSQFKWNEVHYHDTNTIYVVGDNGTVAKSTDAGLNFNLVTQIPANPTCTNLCPSIINNALSVHFISANEGVVGLQASIAKTTDGGLTWNLSSVINDLPTGDAVNITGIHMSSTGLVINVLSATGVFRSIDGGLTWTNTYSFTNRIGVHLTWINDNELWAFNQQDLILKSTDAGATWTIVRPQNQSGPNHYAGHFYLNQNGFFSNGPSVRFTSDGATTDSSSDTNPFTVAALWTWFAPPVCYKLTPCDLSYPILYVSNDYSSIVNEYIQVCPTNIPSNQVNIPSGNTFSIPYTENPVLYELVDCCNPNNIVLITNYNLLTFQVNSSIIKIDQLPGICWSVKKATSQIPPITFTGNLTGYQYADCPSCLNDFPCTPTPVPTLQGCMCFLVEESTDCTDVITLTNLDAPTPFTDCDACTAQNNGPCYLLTDCDDKEHTIVTGDDLSQYLNQTIQIESCPGYCFQVELAENCIGYVSVLPITASFTTCDACNYVPVVPTNLISRRVKPGYDTPACPPDYTEKVNCTFGEAMYEEVLAKRYGLEDCCVIDAQRWTIKKELLDIKVLNIPNPEKPTCYCYEITQGTGTNCFTYIDCTGCQKQVTLTQNQSVNVCAMYKPKLVCPSTNNNYTIVASTTVCTSNADCQPACDCIAATGLDKAGNNVFQYTDCVSGQTIQETIGFEETVYVCAVTSSATNISNVSISVGGSCTNSTECQPTQTCICYEVIAEGSGALDYLNCQGELESLFIETTIRYTICAQEDSIVSNTQISVTPLGECDGIQVCQ